VSHSRHELFAGGNGRPYPIEVAEPSLANGGTMYFDRFNQTAPISAPAGAINISHFTAQG